MRRACWLGEKCRKTASDERKREQSEKWMRCKPYAGVSLFVMSTTMPAF